MSGSSIDALDFSLVTFSNNRFEFIRNKSFPIPKNLVQDLARCREYDIKDVLILEAAYSKFVSQQIDLFKKSISVPLDAVAIHGHTVWHLPDEFISYQMINGGLVASWTKENILTDFRIQDVALDGQGAPFAPIVEQLFPEYQAFCNLGGITNISFHGESNVIAYDVGPCNQLANAISQKIGMDFDKNGKLGQKGKISPQLLNQWLSIPLINAPYPKSIDNKWVKSEFIEKLPNLAIEDLLATTYQFIALTISAAFAKLIPQNEKVLFSGGGVHNKHLMDKIHQELGKNGIIAVKPSDEIIDFKESLLMAYMGYQYLLDSRYTLHKSTGSVRSTCAGALYKGKV